ncbi:MAG TPA: hypothetical protein VL401_02070 [Alphaproteobacteria bacterium]|jgi:hypothetical protein|nr:hypothetical protein [Alphaproteobacteria bacterium]
MTRKKITIKRINASELRPSKSRSFSAKRFIEAAKNLQKALEKEEEKYGKSSGVFA